MTRIVSWITASQPPQTTTKCHTSRCTLKAPMCAFIEKMCSLGCRTTLFVWPSPVPRTTIFRSTETLHRSTSWLVTILTTCLSLSSGRIALPCDSHACFFIMFFERRDESSIHIHACKILILISRKILYFHTLIFFMLYLYIIYRF